MVVLVSVDTTGICEVLTGAGGADSISGAGVVSADTEGVETG